MGKQNAKAQKNKTLTPKSRPDLPHAETGRGLRYSQCPVCREVFSSPGTYEAHRRVAGRMNNYHRICLDPESVGLVLGERDVWITADREEDETS